MTDENIPAEILQAIRSGKSHDQWIAGSICLSKSKRIAVDDNENETKESKELEKEAVKWWRNAAQQNHDQAQFDLGTLLWHGIGAKRDRQAAIAWWRKSAALGNFMAIKEMLLLAQRGDGWLEN